MAFNYQRGDLCPARWTATGLAAVTLKITGWSGDFESLIHVITNTACEGQTARLAGTEDFKGTVSYDIDLDALPSSGATNLRNGYSGIMELFISPTTVHRIPVIVGKSHYESAVGTQVKGSCDILMNCIQNGAVATYALAAAA